MTEELKSKLKNLAEKYECTSFYDEDPSQFLNWYKDVTQREAASFIAAMLAFGNRKQFIPKIKTILNLADKKGGIAAWLCSGEFEKDFNSADGNNNVKFYRFYSYEDMKDLFRALGGILKEYGSLGEYAKCRWLADSSSGLANALSEAFVSCSIVPKGKDSANKRVHMFLRWMVRRNSPVDLGLWDWYSPADLIIPLDTHVLQESVKLGLLGDEAQKSGKLPSGSLKTAKKITDALKEVWPEDPCKGDFALFGLGVDKEV